MIPASYRIGPRPFDRRSENQGCHPPQRRRCITGYDMSGDRNDRSIITISLNPPPGVSDVYGELRTLRRLGNAKINQRPPTNAAGSRRVFPSAPGGGGRVDSEEVGRGLGPGLTWATWGWGLTEQGFRHVLLVHLSFISFSCASLRAYHTGDLYVFRTYVHIHPRLPPQLARVL